MFRKEQSKSPKDHYYRATDFKDVRVAALGHFSIYYKVKDQQIIIVAFWDNRQDPVKLMKILAKR